MPKLESLVASIRDHDSVEEDVHTNTGDETFEIGEEEEEERNISDKLDQHRTKDGVVRGDLSNSSNNVQELGKGNTYRLWLTSLPTKGLSEQLLQRCIKYTIENPRGLCARIMSSYGHIGAETLDSCDRPRWKELVFRLCLFHGVLNERLEFGSLGWNKRYHFSASDLLSGISEMKRILENGNVSFERTKF